MQAFLESLVLALTAAHGGYYFFVVITFLVISFMLFYTLKAIVDLNLHWNRELPFRVVLAATYLLWLVATIPFTIYYWW